MRSRPARLAAPVALVLAVALLGAGCGAAADKAAESAAEHAAEKAAEAGGSGDVDIDVDGDEGKVTYEGEDGKFEIGGGDIPDSFPEDIPLPDGDYTVGTSMETTGADGYIQLQLITGGTVKDQASRLQQGLADGGYEQTGISKQTVGGKDAVNIQSEGHGKQVLVGVTGGATEDQVSVTYMITAADAG